MASESLPCWALIPASGIGSRMQAERPKQYLPLGDRTVLECTLDNLLSHPAIDGAVLVLDEHDSYWQSLEYRHDKPIEVCAGGKQRYHSVLNGLHHLKQSLQQDAIVLIHDAVRPFVSATDLDHLIAAAMRRDDGALLAVPVADTLKRADKQANVVGTTSRHNLWRAFTPQAFRLELIVQAVTRAIAGATEITDDASAMELMGYHPQLISSSVLNIKITYPADLELARVLLESRAWQG